MRVPIITSVSLIAALVGGVLPSSATTYVVRPDGTGDFPTIQAAINACVDGDVIELTAGTFMGEGNRNISYLGKAIQMRSQTDDPATCVIDCEGNGMGIRFENGETSSAGLRGVTIMNGICTDAPPACGGGGVRCVDSSPTILKCTVFSNLAEQGAGLYCDNASPYIGQCTFSRNGQSNFLPAWEGGGIYCYNGSAPEIRECWFVDNMAIAAGGAIAPRESTAGIQRCTFRSNYADGGGAIWSYRSLPAVFECRFEDNESDAGGGCAIACVEGQRPPGLTLMVGCVFAENHGFGGAILLCSDMEAYISNCTFVDHAEGPPMSVVEVDAGGMIIMGQSIIAWNGGRSVACFNDGSMALECCDIYGNAGGDWVDCIATQYGLRGNISEDPVFCDLPGGNYMLHMNSPCAPPNSGGCDLIGALPVGCGATAIEPATWGEVKARFR